MQSGVTNCSKWCKYVLVDEQLYSHAPHDDVSVNDGPHIRRWPHKILYNIIFYNITFYIILRCNIYHRVTIAYNIQYSNMLYRFVA